MQLSDTTPVPAFAIGTVALVLLTLAACAVGPDFHEPAPPASVRYTPEPMPSSTADAPGHAGAAQTFASDGELPAAWWTLFQSEPLDQLIRESLRDSPSITEAKAALRSAAATYAAERGALLLPTADGVAQVTREKVPGAAFGEPSIPSTLFTLYDASVNVSYRLDLFGASRRQLEGLRAQRDYERWELEAAYLSLSGNIVTTAVTVASLHAQIAAANEIVASQHEQLKVVERQRSAGGAAETDVLSQRTQVAQSEAVLPALEKNLAQARHRLAVLSGRPPDSTDVPDFKLEDLTLPTQLPLSLPAKLVRQRPDVQAAEAQLHEASAQAGVATANLYPQLNLSGSIGSETVNASDLFKPGTAAWSIGGSLTQPLFHGGELIEKRKAAFADLDRAAAQYRDAVLSALQDVADTLRALESDARNLRVQADAEGLAARTLEIAHKQFEAGAISYPTLLSAQRQAAQALEARVQAEALRYADTAALLQALGGGWWNRPATAEAAP
jgi:NodT family efflux transporter outer membrane factor (OMF) lipoprotein